jgi:hypothetical protein
MKTTFLFLWLACSGLLSAQNQSQRPAPNPDERAKKEAMRASAQLSLTPDQQSQWEAAAKQRIQENMNLRQNQAGANQADKMKMRESARQNKQRFRDQVASFLNEGQKQKLDEFLARSKERKQNFRRKG